MNWIRQFPDHVRIQVRVVPRASRNEIIPPADDEDALKIRLTAPPVEGKANKALLAFMKNTLHLAGGSLSLIAGEKSRTKTLRVKGTDACILIARITRKDNRTTPLYSGR